MKEQSRFYYLAIGAFVGGTLCTYYHRYVDRDYLKDLATTHCEMTETVRALDEYTEQVLEMNEQLSDIGIDVEEPCPEEE